MSYKITHELKTVVKLALEHGRRNGDIIFKQPCLGGPKARILGGPPPTTLQLNGGK